MEQTLGKRIVSNRKRLGVTQDQLAERLGVTAQAVSKWENDQSCPDITTLPRLAEIFGITTDELLGIQPRAEAPVHQAEVVTGSEAPSGSGNHWEMHYNGGRKSSIAFALWVLLTGGLLLTGHFLNWDVELWEILWPGGLMLFGLFGLYPDFSFLRLGSGLFGGYFLLNNLGFPPDFGRELVLPVLLLLFGLSLLADALRKDKKPRFQVFHQGTPHHDGEKKHTTHLNQEGTQFSCSTSFGEDRYLIDLPRLTEGEASVSFGALTLDLSGCGEFAPGCSIEAECAFGELVILVPCRCRVELDRDTAFASVDMQGSPAPQADTVIKLDCDASFGNITVRYI